MNILVCVKRVPATGSKMTLTADAQQIDTKYLGFTISPHEECAVEEAVRQVEAHGGRATVLTLGPEAAVEQLRDALAIGVENAVLLETDGREWDPGATAAAIADAIRTRQAAGQGYDLLLFGNESADSGGYQISVRVAHALDWPCVTGVKGLAIEGRKAIAAREAGGGREIYEVTLPAVIAVREGINMPRYPTVVGQLKAKKKPIERVQPVAREAGLELVRLKLPSVKEHEVEILGQGPAAAARAVELFERIGIKAR